MSGHLSRHLASSHKEKSCYSRIKQFGHYTTVALKVFSVLQKQIVPSVNILTCIWKILLIIEGQWACLMFGYLWIHASLKNLFFFFYSLPNTWPKSNKVLRVNEWGWGLWKWKNSRLWRYVGQIIVEPGLKKVKILVVEKTFCQKSLEGADKMELLPY